MNLYNDAESLLTLARDLASQMEWHVKVPDEAIRRNVVRVVGDGRLLVGDRYLVWVDQVIDLNQLSVTMDDDTLVLRCVRPNVPAFCEAT